jgi:hypothetical protein
VIQLSLVHTTVCYDKMFRAGGDWLSLPLWLYKPTRPTTHASQYKRQPTLSRTQLTCLLYTFQTIIPSGDRFCVLGTCAGYKFGFKKKIKNKKIFHTNKPIHALIHDTPDTEPTDIEDNDDNDVLFLSRATSCGTSSYNSDNDSNDDDEVIAKDWTSPIYVFFNRTPCIEYVNSC